MFAAVVDVITQPPGNRCDLRVPRIDGFVRVAIVARPRQYLLDVGGNIYDGFKRLFGSDRRVRTVDAHELDQSEDQCDRNKDDLYELHAKKYNTVSAEIAE